MPGLTVCVPAYNAARTLDATVRSILSQDVDLELVVLNNASSDDTKAVAHSFDDARVKVFDNDVVLSIGDNWNKVIGLSTTPLAKVVCADDILMPGSLAAQLAVMADPEIAITSGKFEVIDEDGAVVESGLGLPGLAGRRGAREVMSAIVRRGPADFGPTAAAMFRLADFNRVGGIRGDLVFPMDVDLFARVTTCGDFYGTSNTVAAWRNSTFNMCSRTSTVSKLSDMYRFHHRLRREQPECVTASDVLAGDVRLVRAACERLRARTYATITRQPDQQHRSSHVVTQLSIGGP